MRLTEVPRGPQWLRSLRVLHWILDPVQVLEERARRYGENFSLTSQAGSVLVYFSSPETLEAVFTAKPEQLSSARGNQILQPILGAQSLIALEGTQHQRLRQLLLPPFHGDRMRAYGQLMIEITQQCLQRWVPGQPFLIRPVMQEISLRVILTAVFGLKEGSRYEQLQQLMSAMLEGFTSPLGFIVLFYRFWQRDWGAWSPWGRFLRQRQQLDDLIYAEIDDRRTHPDASRNDILALLLSARDEAGQPLTDGELRDELMTLLFAGHETTASALAWALYWIAYLPEVRTQLLAEIATLDTTADPSEIARLPYLSALCQETLRLYPIAINAFPRVVLQPITLAGYELEPGTVIIPSVYLAHHRAQVYPDPQQFRPERFLERSFSPYEYLPFGGGNRRCIGSAFALFEMKLVLFTLLSQVELGLASPAPVRPSRRGLTIAPPSNLRMVVTGCRSRTEHPSVAEPMQV